MAKIIMRSTNIPQPDEASYKIVAEKHLESRTYSLLRFSPTKTDNKTRKKILKTILTNEKAIGTIEWWERGSIIHKPKVPLDVIIVFEV